MDITYVREQLKLLLPLLVILAGILWSMGYKHHKISYIKYQQLVMNNTRIRESNDKSLKSKIVNSQQWQDHEKALDEIVNRSNGKHTKEEFYTWYKRVILYGSVVTLIISFLTRMWILLIAGPVVIVGLCWVKEYLVKEEKKKIGKLVDDVLPTFIMNINMSMEAGITMENAISAALKTFDSKALYYEDFARILSDTKTNPDNLAKVYNNFAERVDTESVNIFTNTVISSLSNGTDMKVILNREAERLKKEKIKRAQVACDKADQTSTLIAMVLILLPGMLIIVAPFMMNG